MVMHVSNLQLLVFSTSRLSLTTERKTCLATLRKTCLTVNQVGAEPWVSIAVTNSTPQEWERRQQSPRAELEVVGSFYESGWPIMSHSRSHLLKEADAYINSSFVAVLPRREVDRL